MYVSSPDGCYNMPLKEKFPFITEIYPKDLNFEVSGVLGLNGASVDLYSYSNEQGTKTRLPSYSKTTTTIKEEKRRSKNSRTRRYMWVEFAVGSCPCSEGFLRVLRISSLHKNQYF